MRVLLLERPRAIDCSYRLRRNVKRRKAYRLGDSEVESRVWGLLDALATVSMCHRAEEAMTLRSVRKQLAVLRSATGGEIVITSARIEIQRRLGGRRSEFDASLFLEGRVPGHPAAGPLWIVRLSAGSRAGSIFVRHREAISMWHDVVDAGPLEEVILSAPVYSGPPTRRKIRGVRASKARVILLARFLGVERTR